MFSDLLDKSQAVGAAATEVGEVSRGDQAGLVAGMVLRVWPQGMTHVRERHSRLLFRKASLATV